MSTEIEICAWSPEWRETFRRKAVAIREALGSSALRIDHIGSTSIDGLAAKPVIDIQVSVAGFDPIDRLAQAMDAAGYMWRRSNPDLAKRYFRERPGEERTHVHMRRAGSWHVGVALPRLHAAASRRARPLCRTEDRSRLDASIRSRSIHGR